jgi:hypothetical protein
MTNTGGRPPTPPIVVQHILDLHTQGHGRNEIVRLAGVGNSVVDRVCREHGLTFDRSGVDAATRARKTDLAAKRAELEERLLDDAGELRRQLWVPTKYAAASSGDLVTWRLSRPTASDQASLMRACGTAIDKSLRLAEANSETTVDEAKSMLGGIMEQMGLALASEAGPTAERPAE